MTATRTRTGRTHRRSGGRAATGSDRFAERRHEIRKRQGARRLRWVAGLAIVAFVAVAVIGLFNSDLLAVDVVTVNGVERDRAEEVFKATGIKSGQPLIDVDNEVVATLVEDLAWVRSAEVTRSWNGTVVIDVETRRILFALADTAGAGFVGVDIDGIQVATLSGDGVVDSLEPVDLGASEASGTIRPPSIPLIHGLTVDPQPGQVAPPSAALAINFLVSVPDDVRQTVARVEVADNELLLRLNSGSVATLGDSRQLGAKFQSLETILGQVDLACLATIDVSIPSAPSVTRSCLEGEGAGQDG